jgi:biotin carboxyl carrier protein
LTLTLNDPADLRVKQGDRITKGQILAERRPSEQQLFSRSRLQSQLQQRRGIPEQGQLIALQGELAALQTLTASSPLVQSLESRLITLKAEQRATAYQLQQLPLTSRVIDSAYRNQNYRDKQATLEAKRIQTDTEIALLGPQLQQAKIQAQQEHRAKIAEKQAAIAGVQVQVAQAKVQAGLDRQAIADQLRTVDLELERLKARSPYGGTIRRLKVERGTNNEVVAKLRIYGER